MGLVIIFFFAIDYTTSFFLSPLAEATILLLTTATVKTTMLIFLLKWRAYSLGLRGHFHLPPMLLALATLFGLNILTSLLSKEDVIPIFQPASGLLQIFLFMLMVTLSVFFEELLYRRYLLVALKKAGVGSMKAACIAGILFATGHVYLGIQGIVFAFLSSLVLAWLYNRSRWIGPGFIVHLAYNTIILKIHGFW